MAMSLHVEYHSAGVTGWTIQIPSCDSMMKCAGGGQYCVFAYRAGHDSTSENIVLVLRNGLAETGRWEPDQLLYLQLAIDLLQRGRNIPGPG
jgi:hypothetical protein